MAHIAPHALQLRPAALAVVAFHAALLATVLTRLGQIAAPATPDVLEARSIPDLVIRHNDPPPVHPQVLEPTITDVGPPRVPTETSQTETSTVAATGDGSAGNENADPTPTVWTQPVVIERTGIPYPMVGATKPEGVVRLRLRIGVDGRPLDVLIGVSSGSRALDRAAQGAVLHWRFKPRLQNGVPIESWAEMPIVFRLLD
jgi:protein TonB